MTTPTETSNETVARYERALMAKILAVGAQHADETEAARKCRLEVRRCQDALKKAEDDLMVAESRVERVAQIALNDVRDFQIKVDGMRAEHAADAKLKEATS